MLWSAQSDKGRSPGCLFLKAPKRLASRTSTIGCHGTSPGLTCKHGALVQTTLILGAFLIGALILGRYLSHIARFSSFTVTGGIYVLLGLILGPNVSGVMSANTLSALTPLISLLLGVFGFGLGLSTQRRLTSWPTAITGILYWFVVATFVGVSFWALATLTPFFPTLKIGICLTLAALACAGSVHQLDVLTTAWQANKEVMNRLITFALLGELVAVLAFGFNASFLRSSELVVEGVRQLTTVEWLFASAIIGALFGLLFSTFVGDEENQPKLFLTSVGSILFASGIAVGLDVSPMFVNLIVGIVVGLSSSHARSLRDAANRLEHPASVLLLVLAGASWRPEWTMELLICIGLYLALRFTALALANVSMTGFQQHSELRKLFGPGLALQGTFSMALVLDFAQHQPQSAQFILSIMIIAFLVEGLIAPILLRRALLDIGAISAWVNDFDASPSTLPAATEEATRDHPDVPHDAPEPLSAAVATDGLVASIWSTPPGDLDTLDIARSEES